MAKLPFGFKEDVFRLIFGLSMSYKASARLGCVKNSFEQTFHSDTLLQLKAIDLPNQNKDKHDN